MPIEESEFQRILRLFPVVRSRDYHPDSEPSVQSTSSSKGNEFECQDVKRGVDRKYADSHRIDYHDAFWEKLKSMAEKKVQLFMNAANKVKTVKMGPTEAEKFCDAFQNVYMRLVYEELSLDAAQRFVRSS